MMNLATIARNVCPTITKNQLKALRAKLRRDGITNKTASAYQGPYTLWTHLDVVTDVRAENPQIVIDQIANLLAA